MIRIRPAPLALGTQEEKKNGFLSLKSKFPLVLRYKSNPLRTRVVIPAMPARLFREKKNYNSPVQLASHTTVLAFYHTCRTVPYGITPYFNPGEVQRRITVKTRAFTVGPASGRATEPPAPPPPALGPSTVTMPSPY
jgi:hypothetical protein